jgi:hypothetical protein
VSGDGNNNSGRDVRLARDEAVAAGVAVNGLVILTDQRFSWAPEHTNPPGGLEKYYRDNVIGGPGAFVLVAKDFNSFGNLLIKKLIAEIALIGPRGRIGLAWSNSDLMAGPTSGLALAGPNLRIAREH